MAAPSPLEVTDKGLQLSLPPGPAVVWPRLSTAAAAMSCEAGRINPPVSRAGTPPDESFRALRELAGALLRLRDRRSIR